MDFGRRLLARDALHHHRGLMRQLRPKAAHCFLAHDLRQQEVQRAIGQLIFGEQVLALRQAHGHGVRQRIEAGAAQRRRRHDLGEVVLAPDLVDQRQQPFLARQAIHLVDDADARRLGIGDAAQHDVVASLPALRLHQHQRHVHAGKRPGGLPGHVAVQRDLARAVNARRVHEDQLGVAAVEDAEHRLARRLRLARGDAELAPKQMIHERRLADVGAAG